MFSNQNKKIHKNSYLNNISNYSYCCQSPNTCLSYDNRTNSDKELLKQFYDLIGKKEEPFCKICKNVNLIN